MFRLIITGLSLAIVLIVSIVLLPIEWLIGKVSKKAKDRSSRFIIKIVFRVFLFTAGAKVTVIGRDRIPKDKAVLYVGNHRGIFDIIATYPYLNGVSGYVAKKSLKKFPLFSHWMANIKCLFIDRDDARQGLKTILQGIEYIKSGTSIVIFPEGTRSKSDKEMLPFKDGSFKLATKSGCPIVPLAINNTSGLFEDQFPKMKKTHIIIEFLDPIYLDKLSSEDLKNLTSSTQEIIRKAVLKNIDLI